MLTQTCSTKTVAPKHWLVVVFGGPRVYALTQVFDGAM